MRLKHLELQGYKSFANRTEFLFDEQITAIVGPNGTGKSNIADALRWVLGEQSYSTLRAKRTEDMIFAGSDGRPRLGMAEVTVTLDNADGALPIEFTEVTLTRRAYRSGENEYFLNGARVRLRDILELLDAAGLGRSRYLVIGQGLVDAALALRPDQRRELIDEAAGIRPYQLKRDNALVKLAETEANMVRVNDILNELTPRLRRLEAHAERAYEHARLSQELEELLGAWHGYQWHRAQEQLHEAKTRHQNTRQLITRYEAELRALNHQVLECRAEREAQRGRLAELRREEARLRTQYEETRRNLAVRQERARLLTGQRDELESEVATLRHQWEAARAELAEAQEKVRRLEEESARRSAELEERRAAVQHLEAQRESLRAKLTTSQARLMELASRLADHRGRLALLEQRHSELQHAVDEGRATVAELEARLTSLRDEQREAEMRLTTLRTALTESGSRVTALRARLEEVQAQAAERQAQRDRAAEALNRLLSSREALADARARAMASDAALGEILQRHKGRRLVDVLQVPEELEQAVEAALGDRLWSVVVDSRAQALRALHELWEAGGGRVSFLPLDSLRPSGARRRLPGDQAGVLGRLAELVECPARYQPAVEALLGATWLVEDLEVAFGLRESAPDARFVTRRGEVLEPSGVIIGSPAQAGSGLLTHEREWRELTPQIEELDAAHKAHEAATTAAAEGSELGELEAEEQRLADQVRQAEAGAAELRNQATQVEQELAWRRSLLERSQAELEAVAGAVEAQRASLAADEPAYAAHLSELEALQSELGRLEQAQRLRELAAAETAAAVAAQELAAGKGELHARWQELARLEGRLKARSERLEAVTRETQSLADEIGRLDAEQQELFEALSAQESQIQPAEEALEEMRQKERELEQKLSQVRERLRQAVMSEAEIAAEVSRWEERLTHLRAEIAADLELLAVREDHPLQLALELPTDLSPLPAVTVVPEGLERQVQDLKRRLRALGPVDPDIIAEYEATRERYEFLTEQMEDLHKAAEDLGHVISQLDQIMTERFNETFEAVSGAFSRYFTALFGGGSARLVRVDVPAGDTATKKSGPPPKSETLDQVGVEIIARPPGKRPQPLALLSGGERALTAVALIFALLEVSKTPFCLLDEVDAMLDEANVGRFRQALQRLAQRVQFILITHNRTTIEAAHTIYGVSMSADGVSQVISLKLEDAVGVANRY